MAISETDAVVLRYADYREADRILTLFSPECGKLTASVRGVKKQTAKLRFCAEIFHYGHYIFNENKGRLTVTGCSTQESFYPVRFDMDRLWCATFMINTAEQIAVEGQQDGPLFGHLLKGLYEITYRDELDALGGAVAFLCGALRAEGSMPQLLGCQECGSEETAFFDIQSGGALCRDCAAHNPDRLFRAEPELLRDIQKLFSGEELFRAVLALPVPRRKEMFRCLLAYASDRFDCRWKSAEYLAGLAR